MMELISRVRALLRRAEFGRERREKLRCGDIECDTTTHTMRACGEELTLTLKEYELLHLMLEHPMQVFTRDRLLSSIWGYEFDGESRTVDVHIRSLRLKLGAAGGPDRDGPRCGLPPAGDCGMTKRIFRSIFLVALVVLLLSVALLSVVFYNDYAVQYRSELKSEALSMAHAINGGLAEEEYLRSLEQDKISPIRITWIGADGTVRYDNEAAPAQMENHAARTEVADALRYGAGESERYSATLSQKTFYYACRLQDGTVLRLAGTRDSVLGHPAAHAAPGRCGRACRHCAGVAAVLSSVEAHRPPAECPRPGASGAGGGL